MSASFEEKSSWIQLITLILALGAYFVVAGLMMRAGPPPLIAFVPVFAVAVVVLIILMAVGHSAAALLGHERPDERDRLIAWRAESNASWVLGAGVLAGIAGLVLNLGSVWVAHLLMACLFLSEILKLALQLRYYRRGL